ncbi:MAG: hypothetical protein RJB66_143 [Pseudomonadota bacterium]|jgi:HPt (histidine-containing phosphotransfer) domain-containing protein
MVFSRITPMITHYLDLPSVLKSLGNDQQLLNDTLKLTMRVLPKQIQNLEMAFNSPLTDEITLTAHTLKGSLAIFLCRPLIDAAFAIEQAGRANEKLKAQELFRTLKPDLNKFLLEIEEQLKT